MPKRILSLKVGVDALYGHDASVALVEGGNVIFGSEEERYSRQKHGSNEFPGELIEEALHSNEITLSDIDEIIIPYDPGLEHRRMWKELRRVPYLPSTGDKVRIIHNSLFHFAKFRVQSLEKQVRSDLHELPGTTPSIKTVDHHYSHAVSAFHPSGFDEAVVITADGAGEYESTVVWKATPSGIQKLQSFNSPNSLGLYYAIITAFLGYRPNNGEGKIMGLAPYGNPNPDVEDKLRSFLKTGAQYDVTQLTKGGVKAGVKRLEQAFGRPKRDYGEEFNQWHKDLAFATQNILEEMACNLTDFYIKETSISNVALAGGVVLNCKMNKQIRELDSVDDLFIQPVATDAGVALGAAMSEFRPSEVTNMTNVYWGSEYSTSEVVDYLDSNKIDYLQPTNPIEYAANRLSDGDLVGWFQGGVEMGPRALGNRSILADSRTIASRDRVNKFVKHREGWRPFAPSMLEGAAEEYLENPGASPYMIQTFDVKDEKVDEIPAVLHPGDDTLRAQTVREDQNPRYYELIQEFESITGVPVLLNTSFNDAGEPIVRTPREAVRNFYSMGLDVLVLGDVVLEKSGTR